MLPDRPLGGCTIAENLTDDILRAKLVRGLRLARVTIVGYDPGWPARFEARAADLREVLGNRARLVEHIGSTAVPGLAAKPIVDVVVGIDDPDDEASYVPDLEAAGYELRVREPGHRCFRVGEPDEPANVHCYPPDHLEIRRYLAFRNRLRASATDRELYEATKRNLAERDWPDVNYYAEAKRPVIDEIVGRAGWARVAAPVPPARGRHSRAIDDFSPQLTSEGGRDPHTTHEEHAMGKIVSNFFISLDGVVEAPDQWHFPYFNDEMGAAIERGMKTAEAIMMGRTLYGEWASYWPSQGDDVPFASFINTVPKYVVSTTLTVAEWNNTTVVSGDVAAEIEKIKQRTEGDIALSGSATLVRWLLANGLLDELNLMVHPIAVGHGQRLFEDAPTHPLQLVRHEVFTTGVLNLTYAPARAD